MHANLFHNNMEIFVLKAKFTRYEVSQMNSWGSGV